MRRSSHQCEQTNQGGRLAPLHQLKLFVSRSMDPTYGVGDEKSMKTMGRVGAK